MVSFVNQPPRVNLVERARWEGFKTIGLGVMAFPVGLALCVIAGPCGILFGLICIVGSIFAVPVGLWWAVVPTSHSSMTPLGGSAEERCTVAREIEAELAEPGSVHLRLTGRTVLSLTANWLVVTGSDLVIMRKEDLLWVYKVVVTRRRYGITTGRTLQLALHGRRTGKDEVDALEAELPDALSGIQAFAPHAFLGYDLLTERLRHDELAARVDERRRSPSLLAPPPTRPAPPTRPSLAGSAVLPTRPGLSWLSGLFGVFGLGGLVLCGSCLGLVGLGAWLEARMLPLAAACSGTAVPGASAGTLSSRSPIAVMEWTGNEWEQPAGLISAPYKQAHSLGTAELVMCMGQVSTETLEPCRGADPRTRASRRLWLVEAATGRTVHDSVVSGAEPAACDGSSWLHEGKDPARAEIGAFLVAGLGG